MLGKIGSDKRVYSVSVGLWDSARAKANSPYPPYP